MMNLTPQQQAILNGSEGEVKAKIMKTLVMYGEVFGAQKMVEVTSEKGHLVTSFGLVMMKPVFSLMQQLIDSGAVSAQSFTADPRPLDKNVPQSLLQKIVFSVLYGSQKGYEEQLKGLGLVDDDAFSCACYLNEQGNTPKEGEVLSWAESSAVVYANSILGARCNRNSGIIELFGSIVGCVPYFGLLTDEGRKADWLVEVKTEKLPEAQILGSAIGMKAMEDVPYIVGLDRFFKDGLTDKALSYFKDMGAATASNGAVGLYHVENLTPEAKAQGRALLKENAKTYVIDEAELTRVRNSYPCIWKDKDAAPKLCFIGCPHLSYDQLTEWTKCISNALKVNGKKKVAIPTVLTTAPGVKKAFESTPAYSTLKSTGVILSDICPLMYMSNPLCSKMPIITNSNKTRTYTSARYYTDAETLNLITGGASK